jgi:hypothetical protein
MSGYYAKKRGLNYKLHAVEELLVATSTLQVNVEIRYYSDNILVVLVQ